MESKPSSLTGTLREELLHSAGVTKLSPSRRFTTVFLEGSPADALYLIESGLVKLFKRGDDSKEIIIEVLSSGQLFGQQAIQEGAVRNASAEVLQEGVIYVIPRDVFLRYCDARPQLWRMIAEMAVDRKRALEKKIELLCLHDVEYRILDNLRELAGAFGARLSTREYSIPLSQGELASLIGATRETTSTTLNALARRGLIRLGRRQLVVITPEEPLPSLESPSSHAAAQ
jgi:CRP/FNR family cyclic AMP-dependent transcriptional regulator